MSENLKLQITVIINNTLRVIAYIVLAILFNKWWLSLFSILFLTSIENNKKEENK